MPQSPLSRYIGAIRATGGSPGGANIPNANPRRFLPQPAFNPTMGKPRKRLQQAYMNNKTSQDNIMNMLAKGGLR